MSTWREVRNFASQKFRLTPAWRNAQVLPAIDFGGCVEGGL